MYVETTREAGEIEKVLIGKRVEVETMQRKLTPIQKKLEMLIEIRNNLLALDEMKECSNCKRAIGKDVRYWVCAHCDDVVKKSGDVNG